MKTECLTTGVLIFGLKLLKESGWWNIYHKWIIQKILNYYLKENIGELLYTRQEMRE